MGRDPTTARHGDFWLLGFPPGPIRPSLANLVILDSSGMTILMPSLVRTPGQRKTLNTRTPDLKPSTEPDLQVAGLQESPRSQSKEERKVWKALIRMTQYFV
ncbi:hypothetical protein WA026_012003 [Henosepilachna vigintioctopunctata]|uniref:Uncharacterized protein n=1 Tax=Henosepilachna vigintioctopunctata TaxID=420089 RepID=A0AAW1VDT8_9CUCU